MPKVVVDTTPIISLLTIDSLELLEKIYHTIIVPKAVFDELEEGIAKPYTDISHYPWISIIEISQPQKVTPIAGLDKGELEVILLAEELKCDLIVMDELMGRTQARKLGIPLTGTIGVLLRAKSLNLIPEIKPLLTELVDKGRWINKKLMDKALELAGETV
ncbi:MAG: DUF3368 domain-containing protein [Cyclobacteriaceae bacterium]